jgi:hypothetical protein
MVGHDNVNKSFSIIVAAPHVDEGWKTEDSTINTDPI